MPINLIIPMAGIGDRFKRANYKNYKPFTEKSNDYSYLSDTTSFATDDKQITEFIKNITGNNTINKDFRKKQDFSILSSIIAGIISHEVIKITGKYTPIDQQIYFNYESLRGSNFYRSSNTRNSAFLDRDLIRKIKKTNVFIKVVFFVLRKRIKRLHNFNSQMSSG